MRDSVRQPVRSGLPRLPREWLFGPLVLLIAVGAGLLLAQLLLEPPARDMRSLAWYLTLSGGVTLAVGWAGLQAADRLTQLSISAKTFVGAALGSAVGLLNVLVVSQLMFVNTAHDLRLLVTLIVFSGVVTVLFSLWVASTVTGRLHEVTRGIRELSTGHYETRVTAGGNDEVAALAADTNTLAERLEAIEEQRAMLERERRDLTVAISHDLRTPLASMRAMVEALVDEVVEDPLEVARYYVTLRREIERLSVMIDDLFELSQIDAGALQLHRQPVALQEVAAEVVDAMQAQATSREVTLSLRLEGEPPPIVLDGTRIERAVANLVRNALEHTPAGGTIEVVVGLSGSDIAVEVRDSGAGISDDDLPRIWDRFYRAERSRRREAGVADGAGLGLAIVRGIVEAHGGNVEVRSALGAGSTFTIRIPQTSYA